MGCGCSSQVAINTVKLENFGNDIELPRLMSEGASGADICACVDKEVILAPGSFMAIPTGLSFEIPNGFEIQVRPRSGLAAKFGVTVLNTPGTVDSDYRGEVKVILINHSKDVYFPIRRGDRIAQLVLAKVSPARYVVTETLSETTRGDGGFGHTGIQ